MSNYGKIHQWKVETFHADGQRDMTELIVAFRNFANAPKDQTEFMNPESECTIHEQSVLEP